MESFFTFTIDEPAFRLSIILAQFSQKMQGRIQGWKPTSKWLVVARAGSGEFPYEYVDSKYETWNEEVVIRLGEMTEPGTYYIYADTQDPDDGNVINWEYSVRVYTSSYIDLQRIDQPDGFLKSVLGSCVEQKCEFKPLVNNVKYYYGWVANTGYLVMHYHNQSPDMTLKIWTFLKDYDKDGVYPCDEIRDIPEGEELDLTPGMRLTYPIYWYLYKGCNA